MILTGRHTAGTIKHSLAGVPTGAAAARIAHRRERLWRALLNVWIRAANIIITVLFALLVAMLVFEPHTGLARWFDYLILTLLAIGAIARIAVWRRRHNR